MMIYFDSFTWFIIHSFISFIYYENYNTLTSCPHIIVDEMLFSYFGNKTSMNDANILRNLIH